MRRRSHLIAWRRNERASELRKLEFGEPYRLCETFRIADIFPVQRTQVEHRSEADEDVEKSLVVVAPIDHCAGHRSAFAFVATVNQKAQARVVEKAHGFCLDEYILFPMARICSDRNERDDLGSVLAMCHRA